MKGFELIVTHHSVTVCSWAQVDKNVCAYNLKERVFYIIFPQNIGVKNLFAKYFDTIF